LTQNSSSYIVVGEMMIGTVRSTCKSIRAHHHLRARSSWLSSWCAACDPEADRIPFVRFSSSTSNGNTGGDDSGAMMHNLFEQQMMELENERKSVFGEEKTEASSSGGEMEPIDQCGISSDDDNEQMHADRAALFGFTNDERKVWSTAGDEPHTHSPAFMRAVHAARDAHFDDGSGEKEGIVYKDDDGAQYSVAEGAIFEQHTEFTHLTAKGDSVSMVDVGTKAVTRRVAKARSIVIFPPAVMEAFVLKSGQKDELVGPKGPIFATAKIAGIMGAK